MIGKEDGGMFWDLHQSGGNEPTIEPTTFLGKWEYSNLSDGQTRNDKGDGQKFVISGWGDWEHLGCCQAVNGNKTRKQLL